MRVPVIVVLVLLLLPATAGGQPADPAQRLADETADWIGEVLRIPAQRAELVTAADDQLLVGSGGGQVVCSDPSVIHLGDFSRERLNGIAEGRIEDPHTSALLVHELLHIITLRLHPAGEDGRCPFDREVEEGIVEAVTRDLMPAWTHRFSSGWSPLSHNSMWDREVLHIRGASRYLSGCPGWRCREARLIRRVMLLASRDDRRAVLRTAELLREAKLHG
jgi:hypothetical protein